MVVLGHLTTINPSKSLRSVICVRQNLLSAEQWALSSPDCSRVKHCVGVPAWDLWGERWERGFIQTEASMPVQAHGMSGARAKTGCEKR